MVQSRPTIDVDTSGALRRTSNPWDMTTTVGRSGLASYRTLTQDEVKMHELEAAEVSDRLRHPEKYTRKKQVWNAHKPSSDQMRRSLTLQKPTQAIAFDRKSTELSLIGTSATMAQTRNSKKHDASSRPHSARPRSARPQSARVMMNNQTSNIRSISNIKSNRPSSAASSFRPNLHDGAQEATMFMSSPPTRSQNYGAAASITLFGASGKNEGRDGYDARCENEGRDGCDTRGGYAARREHGHRPRLGYTQGYHYGGAEQELEEEYDTYTQQTKRNPGLSQRRTIQQQIDAQKQQKLDDDTFIGYNTPKYSENSDKNVPSSQKNTKLVRPSTTRRQTISKKHSTQNRTLKQDKLYVKHLKKRLYQLQRALTELGVELPYKTKQEDAEVFGYEDSEKIDASSDTVDQLNTKQISELIESHTQNMQMLQNLLDERAESEHRSKQMEAILSGKVLSRAEMAVGREINNMNQRAVQIVSGEEESEDEQDTMETTRSNVLYGRGKKPDFTTDSSPTKKDTSNKQAPTRASMERNNTKRIEDNTHTSMDTSATKRLIDNTHTSMDTSATSMDNANAPRTEENTPHSSGIDLLDSDSPKQTRHTMIDTHKENKQHINNMKHTNKAMASSPSVHLKGNNQTFTSNSSTVSDASNDEKEDINKHQEHKQYEENDDDLIDYDALIEADREWVKRIRRQYLGNAVTPSKNQIRGRTKTRFQLPKKTERPKSASQTFYQSLSPNNRRIFSASGCSISPTKDRTFSASGRSISSSKDRTFSASGRSISPTNGQEFTSNTERTMTIAQRRAEEETKRREEELEKTLNYTFKAKQVPETTTKPLFTKVMQQQKTRAKLRVEARRKELQEMMKPFKTLMQHEDEMAANKEARRREKLREEERILAESRRFRANPVPPTVQKDAQEQLKLEMEQRDKIRQEQVAERAATLLAASALPPRMEMWERKKLEEGDYGNSRTYRKNMIPQFPFQPQIVPKVPNFPRLHEEFTETLANARQKFDRTIPQPFSFDTDDRKEMEQRKQEARRQARLTATLGLMSTQGTNSANWINTIQQKGMSNTMLMLPRRPSSVRNSSTSFGLNTDTNANLYTESERNVQKPDIYRGTWLEPPSGPKPTLTRSVELRMQYRQAEIRAKQLEEQSVAMEEEIRQQKQLEASRNIAPLVQTLEKQRRPEPLAWQLSEEHPTAKAKRRNAQYEMQQRSRENAERIRRAQEMRPPLFLRGSIANAEETSRQQALEEIAQSISRSHEAKYVWNEVSKGNTEFEDVEDMKDQLYAYTMAAQ